MSLGDDLIFLRNLEVALSREVVREAPQFGEKELSKRIEARLKSEAVGSGGKGLQHVYYIRKHFSTKIIDKIM